ncbi:MAG: hypothetical protein QOG72_702 [Sphingomonadales bacterium]|jgi:hypothetical protein|nr:hypothetical protein [Sphingomonadales bacterium]
MAFTDEERLRWHDEKRARERKQELPTWRPDPVAVCVHCHSPFGYGEGYIGEEVALCDGCDGD